MTVTDNIRCAIDAGDANQIATKYLNSALAQIDPSEQSPEDCLKIAQTVALVGILGALDDIAFDLRNEDDGGISHRIHCIADELNVEEPGSFAQWMTKNIR